MKQRNNENPLIQTNMKRTVKKGIIQNIYGLLYKAKSDKCDSAARRAVFNAMYPMKSVAEGVADYRQEAAKRLQPANYDDIVTIINEFNGMTPHQREEALKQPKYMDALRANFDFDKDLGKCVGDMLSEDTEIDFVPLTDVVFDSLCDSNPDWSLGQCMELQAVLCGGNKNEA